MTTKRASSWFLVPVFALVLLSFFAADARSHAGQYRGPYNELREFFRGTNPRLRPPVTTQGGTGGVGGVQERRRVPPVGADGQGYMRWEFWWEHNRDYFLGLRNYQNRERATLVPGSADFLLGGTIKDRVPVVERIDDAVRRDVIVPVLLRGIRDADPDVRAASWIALGKTATEQGAEFFARGVSDRDPDVQKAALLGLGLLGKAEGIPILAKAMRNEGRKIRVRMAAVFGLAFLEGDEVTQLLLAYLRYGLSKAGGDAEEMSIATLRALAVHGNDAALETLTVLARGSGRATRVRAELFLTIGRLGRRESIPLLQRALVDRSIPVRRAAALALGEIDTYSIEDEELTKLIDHRRKWKSLPDVSEEALAELEALIEEKEKEDADERKEIVRQRDAIAKSLIRALTDDNDVQVRNYAAISLGKTGGRGATAALLGALNSGYSISLQGFAALGLGILGDPSVGPVLLERLNRAGYESHRGAVAIALGMLREESALPALTTIVLYRGVNSNLRGYAAQAIGLMGDRDLVPDLQRILAQERGDEELLRGITMAVGMLGDRGATTILKRLLSDAKSPHTAEVRSAVVLALGLIRDRQSVSAMVDLMTKPVAGKRTVQSQARAFAAAALGYIGDSDLLPRMSLIANDYDHRNFVQGMDDLLRVL